MSAVVRGEARRALILDAAIRVIGREGAGALTHRRVAAEAELPLAATTYWFASKDALLAAAYRLAAERELDRLAAAVDAATGDLAETLAAMLEAEVADGRDALVACFATWFEAVRHPALAEIEREWTAAYSATMRRLLEDAGAPDPDGDAPLLAATFDGILLALLTRDRSVDDFRPQLRRLVDALLAGASAR